MSGHEDDDEVVHHDAMYVSMDQPSLWVEDDPYMSAIVPAVKNRGVFISACGNFACAYNFGIIDYALHSLCAEYPIPHWALSAVPSMAFYGAITGQLCLGYAGDCMGRRRAMLLTLSLVAAGALGSGLLTWGADTASAAHEPGHDGGLYYMLCGCRFLLGVGLGGASARSPRLVVLSRLLLTHSLTPRLLAANKPGIYPLTAVATAESATPGESREFRASKGFFFQGIGGIGAPVVAYLTLRFVTHSPAAAWRVLLLFGALPVLVVLKDALGAKESAEFVAAQTAAAKRGSGGGGGVVAAPEGGNVEAEEARLAVLLRPRYATRLLGTALSWFFFDIAFYGIIIFLPSIINSILAPESGTCGGGAATTVGPTPSPAVQGACSQDTSMQIRVAGYSAAINCLGLPALALSIYLVGDDRLGARRLQLLGFGAMALSLAVFGAVYARDPCNQSLILGVFCVTFTVLNFGTGVTTYLMPARLFPPQVRSTANGISSAAGKAGSAFATTVFPSLSQTDSVFVAAAASALGLLVTLLFIPQHPGSFDDDDDGGGGALEMKSGVASSIPSGAGGGGGGGFSFVGRMEAAHSFQAEDGDGAMAPVTGAKSSL